MINRNLNEDLNKKIKVKDVLHWSKTGIKRNAQRPLAAELKSTFMAYVSKTNPVFRHS